MSSVRSVPHLSPGVPQTADCAGCRKCPPIRPALAASACGARSPPVDRGKFTPPTCPRPREPNSGRAATHLNRVNASKMWTASANPAPPLSSTIGGRARLSSPPNNNTVTGYTMGNNRTRPCLYFLDKLSYQETTASPVECEIQRKIGSRLSSHKPYSPVVRRRIDFRSLLTTALLPTQV